MTSTAPRSDDGSPVDPELLFDEYLSRRDREGEGVLDELCSEHPHAADDLRRLQRAFSAMDDAVDALGEDSSLQHTPRVLPSDDDSIAPIDDPTGVLLDALEGQPIESIDPDDGAYDPTVALDPDSSAARTGPGSGSSVGSVVDRLTQASSRYAAGREIARGGMGAILKTWDADLRRYLAMKVMLPGAKNEEASSAERRLGRFLEEAQITGQLDHPGIVPVHELGRDEDGQLYFTMRFVRGMSFARVVELVTASKDVRAKRDEWTTFRALGVLRQVCDTLAYAHSKGVVHRDIKPANLMVGRFGEVYVMDWGLAKVVGRPDPHDLRPATRGEQVDDVGADDATVTLDSADATLSHIESDRRLLEDADPDSPLRTMDGAVVGTPAYMSPEQARGELDAIGPATDIYAVGALLYFLLTGHAPYCDGDVRPSPHAILRAVRREPPTPMLQLDKRIPGELVSITEKAMARRPDERYADMTEMADDLRAFLERRVVRAYKTGAFAELSKWVVRNKLTASVLIAALLLLGTFSIQLYRSSQNAEQRAFEAEQATAEATQANIDLATSDAAKTQALSELELQKAQLTQALGENQAMAYTTSLTAAVEHLEHGETDDALALLEACAEDDRGWEWQHLRLRVDGGLGTLEVRERPVVAQATSAATGLLATLSDDGRVHVWDVPRATRVTTFEVGDVAHALAFHPDGRLVASGDARGRLAIWDVFTGALRHERTRLGEAASVGAVVFHPDGGRLFAGFDNGELFEWSVDTGRERVYYGGPTAPVLDLAIEPEGDFLVSGGEHGFATLWYVPEGRFDRGFPDHGGRVHGVAWNPIERWVATACADGLVRIIDLSERGADTRRLRVDAPATAVTFAPDGASLAVGCSDGAVVLLDAYSDARLAVWRGHRDVVTSVVFNADGHRVVSADAAGAVRLWDPQFGDGVARLHGHGDEVGSLAVSPHDARLAVGTLDGYLHLWDAADLHKLGLRELGGASIAPSVAFSRDGRNLAVGRPLAANGRHAIDLWPISAAGLADQARESLPGHTDPVSDLAFGPDGRWLASAATDEVIVWDVLAGAAATSLAVRDARVAFHPREAWAVAGGSDGVLGVLDPATGSSRPMTVEQGTPVLDVAFDDRGRRLAIAREDGVLILDAVTLQRRQWLETEGETPTAVAWEPDGARLAVASTRGTSPDAPAKLRLWHAEQGRELITLRLEQPAHLLAFDASGERLVLGRGQSVELLQTRSPLTTFDARVERRDVARKARVLVEDLLDLHVDPREVGTALFRDEALDEAVRAEALRRLRDFGTDAHRLANAAWETVLDNGAGHSAWRDALRRARAADRLVPDVARQLCILGGAYTRLGETGLALAALERAQQINTLDQDHPGSWAHFFLGFAFLEDDRPRRARTELDAALRLLSDEVMLEGFSASDSRQLEAQARQLMPLVESLAAERDA